ncbi:MAG: thiopurine S-methyltransferase [Pseudomonadota bacterium]
MEHAFWQERWRENRIAFHEAEPNPLLTENYDHLKLSAGDKVFVPLCGKSFDLDWLLLQGVMVIGAELNEGAVQAVFERLRLTPEVNAIGTLKRYSAEELTMFAGDFFQLQDSNIGPVNAVYDRAALVAMPDTMRADYAQHLMAITNKARQLLVSFDYDQSQMSGPPFSVPSKTIATYYDDLFKRDLVADTAISGALAERCSGRELVWLLSPLDRLP